MEALLWNTLKLPMIRLPPPNPINFFGFEGIEGTEEFLKLLISSVPTCANFILELRVRVCVKLLSSLITPAAV